MTIYTLIFVCLVDSLLIYVFLQELLESLTVCSPTSFDYVFVLLMISNVEQIFYTIDHMELCTGVESVCPFFFIHKRIPSYPMLKWITGSSISMVWILLNHIPHHLRKSSLVLFSVDSSSLMAWVAGDWLSSSPNFYPLGTNRASSFMHSSHSLLNLVRFIMA